MQQLNTATNENADQWNYWIKCISPTVPMCITCCPVMHQIILQLATLEYKCVPKRSIMMQFIFKASRLLVLMLHDKQIISLVTESQLVDRLLVISATTYYLVREVCQALANQQLVTNFLANWQLAYVSINKQGYPHYQNLLNLNSRNLPMRYYSKSVSLEELVHSFFSLSNLVF